MTEGRPLHAVFSELLGDDIARQAYAADPTGPLGDAGHGELTDELLAEAIVSFADTAPPEVAEHLAPFVMAHSAVPGADGEPPEAPAGLDLLATAPAEAPEGPDVDALEPTPDWAAPDGAQAQPDVPSLPDDLDFGGGATDAPSESDVAGIPAAGSDAVPVADGGAADVPADPFPATDVLPSGPAPEADGDEDGGQDVPD